MVLRGTLKKKHLWNLVLRHTDKRTGFCAIFLHFNLVGFLVVVYMTTVGKKVYVFIKWD